MESTLVLEITSFCENILYERPRVVVCVDSVVDILHVI